MRTDTAPTVYRGDYQPYPYAIDTVELTFELDPENTEVTSRLSVRRPGADAVPMQLFGEAIDTVRISIDGQDLAPDAWHVDGHILTLHPQGDAFELEIVTRCHPARNTSLMGLYVSGEKLFTQCEAEGFRRITWFPDRPDVMSRYTVTLRGSRAAYPLLLSNGNLVHEASLPDGRHEARWEDPFPKPSYLFALVAGDFDCRETTVQTRSGRNVLLQVYSDRGSYDRTAWALECLERSLRWDETRFGLELDLDRFMIVAARDFNMGAMENKGLNVFNSAYVLADKDTATDAVYRAIEAVIGHEYFHNWTGNRVTCRDWFQLSLKEGLTVFRDQEFSADMLAANTSPDEALSARAVKRIDDVSTLRVAQFPEDAGPMAHPIRPESYQEIGNFYTATVYEKGAEVIHMQHTLLGEDAFQEGMREYFRRHDGQAVTCDDFLAAMDTIYRQRNPGRSLDVFKGWYSQAGTPRVQVDLHHDEASAECTVTLTQSCPPVGVEKLQNPPAEKAPLHIPLALGMLDTDGTALPLQFDGESRDTVLLELTERQASWTFPNIARRPVLSLLRNFSAPVSIDYPRDNAELVLLASHDPNPFARWEAGQELATRQLLALVNAAAAGALTDADSAFIDAWRAMAHDETLNPAYRARVLALPGERELLEKTSPMDPQNVVLASRQLRATLGRELADDWHAIYRQAGNACQGDYSPDALSTGWRSLKNLALARLVEGRPDTGLELAERQYRSAGNMTDRLGGLSAMLLAPAGEAAERALEDFYQQWQHDPLVMDKWFALQATARHASVETVRSLMLHPAFSLRNPNRARALIFQFCINNLAGIHSSDGYAFWAEQVLALDAINPEIAARLTRAFDNWTRFAPSCRDGMKSALETVQASDTLSRNVSEIVSKSLTL